MRHGGIISAAIDVLKDIEEHHRPANLALKDWGLSHRFAGSGDRAAIGNLVFDALRHRNSLAWRMGEDTPRALAIGAYGFVWGHSPSDIAKLFAEDRHAPEPLSEQEMLRLAAGNLGGAPASVAGDFPEWLEMELYEAFGDDLAAEMAALAGRAPVDLRVNTLKSDREKVLKALQRFSAVPIPYSPVGIRLPVGQGPQRPPHVQSETGYKKGWFEIQDEGSQLAAILVGARPGEQVADICAGGGGKTLAMAATMEGKGQIHAFDTDRRRLGDIHERVQRAGARNVQILGGGERSLLEPLQGRMDLVLVDAPCTGSGTWRRRPDAKWRVSPTSLAERHRDQTEALDLAAPLVKQGGRIAYVTCSILPSENDARLEAFLAAHSGFEPVSLDELLAPLPQLRKVARPSSHGLLLTPYGAETDGFYTAAVKRI